MAVLEDVQTQEGSIFPMGMHWQRKEYQYLSGRKALKIAGSVSLTRED